MPGTQSEKQEGLGRGFAVARFRSYLTGKEATGWQCVDGRGEALPAPAGPPPPDPRLRYTCTCMVSTCGGTDGIMPGDKGQEHSGIAIARLSPKYGPERRGAEATGWSCKPEALPPSPKFTCTCERDVCGGQNSTFEGERGQRHSGVAESRLQAGYGPERSGAEATGWSCVEEKKPPVTTAAAAPAVGSALAAPIAGGPDPGYQCRCEGFLGCGAGGAPYGKKNELRQGVPGEQIDSLYHSDQPNGWACTRPAGFVTALPGVDPGYVCRCQGLGPFGCGDSGSGSAQGKKGETRVGIPRSHLTSLYYAGGWVCTLK